MDRNQRSNLELLLLDLSSEATDRESLEWLEAVLAEIDRKQLPSIQID